MPQKRVVAINDISCLGKCSLTIALPIISAAGIETAVIPTVVLSTHTGGFTNNTVRDLSDDIVPVAKHWNAENITADAVYTGYLCSKKQVDLVLEAISLISNSDTIIITDPVMGDKGRLYKGFTKTFPNAMLKLCAAADIITPNVTEAALMLGVDYLEPPYSEEYIDSLLEKLYEKTGAEIVLTGVSLDSRRIGVAVFNGEKKKYIFAEKLDSNYHGTGDIFASVLTASVMNDRSLTAATQIAVNFTFGCIKKTMEDKGEMKFGVNFEGELPNLIKYLEL